MVRARALVTIFVAAIILYFIAAGIAVWAGWLKVEWYALAGGILGSLASTLGLISLSRPALDQADLENIQIDSLRKIAEASEEISELESKRESELNRLEEAKVLTREQMQSLEKQKKEMEILVQRASLSLFLQEQHRLYSERVSEAINKSSSLKAHLTELERIGRKLDALNQEIETDPHVDILKSIVASAKRDGAEADGLEELPPLTRAIVRMARLVADNLLDSFKKVIR